MDKKVSHYDTYMLVAYIILVSVVMGILPGSRINVTSPYELINDEVRGLIGGLLLIFGISGRISIVF